MDKQDRQMAEGRHIGKCSHLVILREGFMSVPHTVLPSFPVVLTIKKSPKRTRKQALGEKTALN